MSTGSAPRTGYVFGRFRLSADGTLLVRDGEPVPLAPKVLKTLLALVERAGEVVRKTDLLEAVWPNSFVEETGLTRNISLLRDALGDDTQTLIVTVARIGYRFSARVARVGGAEESGGSEDSDEPGRRTPKRDVPANPAAYEYFLRANECIGPQGLTSAANLRVARELYGRAIEEDRGFAPAWARLGRCLYLIGKTEGGERDSVARAERCFQEALAISPDLALAHNLYAWLEIDQGRARSAMVRLISRALSGSVQPELFAALTQACRFCGLLEASVAAHDLGRELDAKLATSAYQTWWQLGDHDRVLREGLRPWILEALIVGMRGDQPRAIELLRARETLGVTGLAQHLMEGLRAVFEGRADAAYESASRIFEAFPDPEAVFYAARYVSFFGNRRALDELGRALDGGFVLYRALLRADSWLDPLRDTPEFQRVLDRARETYRDRLRAFHQANGAALLGFVPAPEEIEAPQAQRAR